VESAISSAASSRSDLPRPDDHVPHTYSFGIYLTCISYHHGDVACSNAPFDAFSLLLDSFDILPSNVADTMYERWGDLSPLAEDLDDLSTSVLVHLVAGTAHMMLSLAVTSWLAFDYSISRKTGCNVRVLLRLFTAMCFIPYLALIVKQSILLNRLNPLSTWVMVERGAVFGLSVGLCACAVLFAALSTVMTCETGVQWIEDRFCITDSAQDSSSLRELP
jgi:ABC-type glycerol-3-phosphate transport system permease component